MPLCWCGSKLEDTMSNQEHTHELTKPSLLLFSEEILHRSLRKSGATEKPTLSSDIKCNGVWEIELLSDDFSQDLASEVAGFVKAFPLHHSAIFEYGIDLFQLGFRSLFEKLAERLSLVFGHPAYPKSYLEVKSSYVYLSDSFHARQTRAGRNLSSIILNCCLVRGVSGGELVFAKNPLALEQALSRVSDVEQDLHLLPPQLYNRIKQDAGKALLYDGRHLRGLLPVTQGAMMNLVISFDVVHPLPGFLSLPAELQAWIISFLPPVDVLSVAAASKSFYELCQGDDVWGRIGKRYHFPSRQDFELPKRHQITPQNHPPVTYPGIVLTQHDLTPAVSLTKKQQFICQYLISRQNGYQTIYARSERMHALMKGAGGASLEWDIRVRIGTLNAYVTDPTLCKIVRVNRLHVPDQLLFPYCPTRASEASIGEHVSKYMDALREHAMEALKRTGASPIPPVDPQASTQHKTMKQRPMYRNAQEVIAAVRKSQSLFQRVLV